MTITDLYQILLEEKPSINIKEKEEDIMVLIPELKECKGFKQNSIWHNKDVYNHILSTIDNTPNHLILRLSALFHDIGKPLCYTEDENKTGHFYEHWLKSEAIFLKFAENNKIDTNIKNLASKLIRYHDLNIRKLNNESINKLITIFTKEELILLFQLKRADLLAQNESFHHLLEKDRQQEIKILTRYK